MPLPFQSFYVLFTDYHIIITNIMLNQKQINDYRLEDIVGEGAYGKVYRAVGPDAKTYAIKLIPINKLMKEAIR